MEVEIIISQTLKTSWTKELILIRCHWRELHWFLNVFGVDSVDPGRLKELPILCFHTFMFSRDFTVYSEPGEKRKNWIYKVVLIVRWQTFCNLMADNSEAWWPTIPTQTPMPSKKSFSAMKSWFEKSGPNSTFSPINCDSLTSRGPSLNNASSDMKLSMNAQPGRLWGKSVSRHVTLVWFWLDVLDHSEGGWWVTASYILI